MARYVVIALATLGAAACTDHDGKTGGEYVPGPGDEGGAPPADEGGEPGGGEPAPAIRGRFFYVMTNDAQGNEVVAFEHREEGGEHTVTEIDRVATDGLGTGELELPSLKPDDGVDPLLSQGSLHRAGEHLLAVNAGSGSVSVFHVEDDGTLVLRHVQDTGGYPDTVTSLRTACSSGSPPVRTAPAASPCSSSGTTAG
jgi:hypothetical protein